MPAPRSNAVGSQTCSFRSHRNVVLDECFHCPTTHPTLLNNAMHLAMLEEARRHCIPELISLSVGKNKCRALRCACHDCSCCRTSMILCFRDCGLVATNLVFYDLRRQGARQRQDVRFLGESRFPTHVIHCFFSDRFRDSGRCRLNRFRNCVRCRLNRAAGSDNEGATSLGSSSCVATRRSNIQSSSMRARK